MMITFHPKILHWIIILMVLLIGCQKETTQIDFSATEWEIIKVKWSEKSDFQTPDHLYILNFENDSIFSISLGANNCQGQYFNPVEGNIDFSALGCTKMCCDSDFAIELSLLIPKMNHYYGKGESLYLQGVGEIELRRY